MPNVFRPVSLVIETDLERSAVNDEMIVHPAGHNPAASRIVVHETLHYWQQLSQSSLVRLAAEDLARLEEHERDGTLPAPGARRHEYMRRHEEWGFSALDLQEALARYWDVHILGPPLLLSLERADPNRQWEAEFEQAYAALEAQGRLPSPDGARYSGESYDLAMATAAGSYARPYLMLRAELPSLTAAGAFPLLAHIALHTPEPVIFFARLVEFAVPMFGPGKAPNDSIEDFWKQMFLPAVAVGIKLAEALNLVIDFMPLLSSELEETLGRSKPHDWARHRLEVAINVLAEQERAREAAAEPGKAPLEAAVAELMLRLATPGVPKHRAFLAAWLSPPLVKFADGKREILGRLHRRLAGAPDSEAERRLSAEFDWIADEAEAQDARWQAFVRAGLRRGFAPRPGPPLEIESAIFDAAQAIARLGARRDPILQLWLAQLLDPEIEDERFPLGGKKGWHRFVRAMLVGRTTRADDIAHVYAMLLMQLATRQGLVQYDAESGLTWEWAGSPLEVALAAEFCVQGAKLVLDDPELTSLGRAIEMVALGDGSTFMAMSHNGEPTPLTAALARRIAHLRAADGVDEQLGYVGETMAKYGSAATEASTSATAPNTETSAPNRQ